MRLICIFFCLFLNLAASCKLDKDITANLSVKKPTASIEGSYEFVSETIKLTEPEIKNISLTNPTWAGQWIFKDCRFSSCIMVTKSKFGEGTNRESEYITRSGKYKLEGTNLSLKIIFAFYSDEINSTEIYDVKFEEDKLTLIRYLTPHPENLSKGEDVIVLRRTIN